jgi:antirestriction protein ArdC
VALVGGVRTGKRAVYFPARDEIFVPPRTWFASTAAYYSTVLHEIAHWTGHGTRLGRHFGGDKRSPEYAREEVVAELCACFLLGMLAVPGARDELPNHARYVWSWLEAIPSYERVFWHAYEDATRATQFLAARLGWWGRQLSASQKRWCGDREEPVL